MNKNTKRNILIGSTLAGLGLGTYVFIKAMKRIKEKAVDKAIVTGGNKILGINIPDIAKQIGIEMGYAYPVWDARRWSENDDAVKILVLKVSKPYIKDLISNYYKIYKRNLTDDLRTNLDDFETVKYLFV